MEESTPQPRLLRLGDLLADWQQDAETAHEAYITKKPRGPVTSLDRVDDALGGAFADGIHVVHGTPGAGKSAFVLQVAASCQCPAILVSCEMAPLELLRRTAARCTGTFLGKFKSGELNPEESLAYARRAAAAAPDLRIVDATRAHAAPSWLLQQAQPVVDSGQHLLIIIDSLHSWAEGMGDGATEYETLNEGLAALRRISHILTCPVLIVCERNRATMKAGGQHASAGTRRIEYGGETVIDLHREDDAKPDAFGEVPVELRFGKNRNGTPNQVVKLLFHGAKQQFRQA